MSAKNRLHVKKLRREIRETKKAKLGPKAKRFKETISDYTPEQLKAMSKKQLIRTLGFPTLKELAKEITFIKLSRKKILKLVLS